MRVAPLLALLVLVPTSLAASGAFTRGDTLADGHSYVIHTPSIVAGDRVDVTLAWSSGAMLQVWVGFTCFATPPLGLAPPECYQEYATHEATGCGGWGSTLGDTSPATVSFTAPFPARYEVFVRGVAETGAVTFYSVDASVNGAARGMSKLSEASTGPGWMSCNVGHEGV